MYRVSRSRGSTLCGNNYVITTHCEDNSSNTEVGNRVFANFNSSSQRLTTRSLLTQRNNDYMKFSWDPMQVVNISRQQKAVCNREIDKLRGLERYFTRQNHIEAYKQSSEIDKFRAKLLRLNKLRMPNENKNKRSGAHFFPITKSTRKPRISNPTATTNYNSQVNSLDGNVFTTASGTDNVTLDKRTTVCTKGLNKPGGSTETNNYCSIERLSSQKNIYTTTVKPGGSNLHIKPCYSRADPVLRRYQKSDKPTVNIVRNTRVNKVDSYTKSDTLEVGVDSYLNRLGVDDLPNGLTSYKNKKCVRFCEEDKLSDGNKNSYDNRKFTQLVKLAHSISGK